MATYTFSGWLDKRGGQDGTKGWKRRWCSLSDNTLRYYKGDSDSSPAGTIFGEDIEDVAEEQYESQKDPKHGFIFKVVTKGRDYIFNATSADKRREWVKKMKHMCDSHKSDPSIPSLRYATAEVFLSKGVRINGDVGTVLSNQLVTPTSRTVTEERGWYVDTPQTQTSILNLFTQHGWTLLSAFQSNTTLPGSSSVTPADLFIFTHPNS